MAFGNSAPPGGAAAGDHSSAALGTATASRSSDSASPPWGAAAGGDASPLAADDTGSASIARGWGTREGQNLSLKSLGGRP